MTHITQPIRSIIDRIIDGTIIFDFRKFEIIFILSRKMSVDLAKLNEHLAKRSYVEGSVVHLRAFLIPTYLSS